MCAGECALPGVLALHVAVHSETLRQRLRIPGGNDKRYQKATATMKEDKESESDDSDGCQHDLPTLSVAARLPGPPAAGRLLGWRAAS
jgi:hypothetical protein